MATERKYHKNGKSSPCQIPPNMKDPNTRRIARGSLRLLLGDPKYESFKDRLDLVIESRGWMFALGYIKDCKLSVKRYSAGCPVSRSEVGDLRLTKDGLPSILGKSLLTRIRSRDLESIQGTLTVLKIGD